ncbi:dolichol kinase [Pleosporales sp. CAS-2024a]
MSEEAEPPDARLDAPTVAELETLELFRRSPHPYLRHRDEIRRASPVRAVMSNGLRANYLSPSNHTIYDADGRKRRKASSHSHSPSESGTEADDEGYSFVKALPPPPLRPHKGLRDARSAEHDAPSPPLTPTQIDDEGKRYSEEYFNEKKRSRRGVSSLTDEEARCWEQLLNWHRVELLAYTFVVLGLLVFYPIRVFYYSWRRGNSSNLYMRKRIHVPAAFDPATILYPTTLPVLISISLYASFPKPLLANILLALAALPARLIPFKQATLGYSNLHWFLSVLPLMTAENMGFSSRAAALKPSESSPPSSGSELDPELLVTLFALHQALLPPLYYLTTTSLLPTELHLLSIGLINLFLFSDSPQAGILKALMWLGGVGLFVSCGNVLTWGVALARIPRWRFRRAGQTMMRSQSFLHIVQQSLQSKKAQSAEAAGGASDSDADEDEALVSTTLQKTKSLRVNILDSFRKSSMMANGIEAHSAAETRPCEMGESVEENGRRPRRNTLPVPVAQDHTSMHRYGHRKRTKSVAQSYLNLTPRQATMRKWLYAAYFYLVVVLMILGPLRYVIGKSSLHSHEPFGWAVSYLLGNIPRVRWEVYNWDLDGWIPLPPLIDTEKIHQKDDALSVMEHLRHVVIGEANTRLVLAAYCAATIVLGLISVFSLSAVVEVDTRRKVFHGTMVAMLLPTIFVDPCFVALALALVLAIFLLLDLIRASQLPPLSTPIARFLTPYVDGRDLRGPVVVSHIFLLIGCAIPLWLSLAGVERCGEEPWEAWNVKSRDVSMLSGVVCVGMGDAAASLVGRRYGRRKWPWAGGKSLEGSLAFAVAVTVGLVFGKAWLGFGWASGRQHDRSVAEWMGDAVVTMVKAALCAAGASLNEAVLTGGNDNVIVPVVLWILVRGVRL